MREASESTPTGPAAFESDTDVGAQAQAAILLGIGAQLRGDRVALQATAAAAAQPTDMFMAETLDEFPIPRLAPAGRRISARAIGEKRFGFALESIREEPKRLSDIAAEVYQTRSTTAAAVLAQAALHHPDELVRIAAAHAALAVTTETDIAYQVLVAGTRSKEELARELAATVLARYQPADPALRDLTTEPSAITDTEAHTSTLVHGTWAANGTWWPPGGNFFNYIDASVWNDLYSNAADCYRWSGGYSDGARDQGADLLVNWIQTKGLNDLSLMAHSHGGSVAMLASWRGVTFNRIVFLSCPVHPSKYNMNFAAAQKVTSIRVKLDLVLLADLSGFKFSDTRYNEHVLPVWFNHSATHDPAIWGRYNIPAML